MSLPPSPPPAAPYGPLILLHLARPDGQAICGAGWAIPDPPGSHPGVPRARCPGCVLIASGQVLDRRQAAALLELAADGCWWFAGQEADQQRRLLLEQQAAGVRLGSDLIAGTRVLADFLPEHMGAGSGDGVAHPDPAPGGQHEPGGDADPGMADEPAVLDPDGQLDDRRESV